VGAAEAFSGAGAAEWAPGTGETRPGGAGEGAGWEELNQQYLMLAVALLRARIESREMDPPLAAETVAAAREQLRLVAAALPGPAPLDSLSATFGLSAFECDILVLCAGVELDAAFGDLCRAITGGRGVTFGLALGLGGAEAHWSAVTPGGALREWGLVELDVEEGLTTAPLRINERVLHHLTGLRYLDPELAGYLRRVDLGEAGALVPSHAQAAGSVLRRVGQRGTPPVIQFAGPDEDGKLRVAQAVCQALGLELYLLPGGLLPRTAGEVHRLSRLWEREAFFSQAALLVDAEDLPGGDPERGRSIMAFVEGIRGLVFVAARERLPLRRRPGLTLDIGRPTSGEQAELWRAFLGEVGTRMNGEVDRLTTHFDLDVPGIEGAAQRLLRGESDGAPGAALWDACRIQARPRLDDLARRIEPTVGWDALVLPELQMQTLRSIAAHVRHRSTVHGAWGFESRSTRGSGISALFAGPSGTGKTMAAEVLAAELALDLYVIDLSQVVNKYIGETEKNLARVFDAAERGGAVLLFDEADALFGKRSEVKDSHDRYANIEVSYLLQRMESYRGLAILTTNQKSALDDAFLRRLRFVVTFPFPGAAQRGEIWRRIFPASMPVGTLDHDRLARLNVAGGHIRNIALNAAFLAAEGGGVVEMEHLMAAARVEYAKLEKPFTETDPGGRR